MSGRRDEAKIAAEIVRAASGGTRKTPIMYGARLNYKQLNRYLDELTKEGLIHSDGVGKIFTSTERGKAFLSHYDEVESLSEALGQKERAMHEFLPAGFGGKRGDEAMAPETRAQP